MAWYSASAGAEGWFIFDTDREPEQRVVAARLSWTDAEAWCRFHAMDPVEYENIRKAIDKAEPF